MSFSTDIGKILVVIPTYNEKDALPTILDRVRKSVPCAEILVVDDRSPDGTGEIAQKRSEIDRQIHVMHRLGKGGLGAAYLAGFAWGLQNGFEVLVEMDADGSHQPEELPKLLKELESSDVVLGSRWIEGGGTQNWSKGREALSRGGNRYARFMLAMNIYDSTGGYRAFKATTLRSLDLNEVASQGYCFQVDLAWRAMQRGFTLKEVPITFVEREVGTSKMSRRIVTEALWRVTLWGIQSRTRNLTNIVTGRKESLNAL